MGLSAGPTFLLCYCHCLNRQIQTDRNTTKTRNKYTHDFLWKASNYVFFILSRWCNVHLSLLRMSRIMTDFGHYCSMVIHLVQLCYEGEPPAPFVPRKLLYFQPAYCMRPYFGLYWHFHLHEEDKKYSLWHRQTEKYNQSITICGELSSTPMLHVLLSTRIDMMVYMIVQNFIINWLNGYISV